MDWLTQHKSEINDCDILYSLQEAKDKYEVVELIEDQSWLVLRPVNDHWLDFAILRFSYSYADGREESVMAHCVWHGGGTLGLRECRHSYFGEDGYVFYLHGPTVIKALQELSKYFDEMV